MKKLIVLTMMGAAAAWGAVNITLTTNDLDRTMLAEMYATTNTIFNQYNHEAIERIAAEGRICEVLGHAWIEKTECISIGCYAIRECFICKKKQIKHLTPENKIEWRDE